MKSITHQWAGADWLVAQGYAKGGISELGRNVADLLGYLTYGLYHMDARPLREVDWSNDKFIDIRFRPSMATFDGDTLTRLVILCHDMEIRGDVQSFGRFDVRLVFHARKGRTGGISERHPSIEDAVARVRGSVKVKGVMETPAVDADGGHARWEGEGGALPDRAPAGGAT